MASAVPVNLDTSSSQVCHDDAPPEQTMLAIAALHDQTVGAQRDIKTAA
jgi:hypothetical protein